MSGIALAATLLAAGCANMKSASDQVIVRIDSQANVDKEEVEIDEIVHEIKWTMPATARKMTIKFVGGNPHNSPPDIKCNESSGPCYLRPPATAGKGRGCKDARGNDVRECRYEYVVKIWPKDGGPPIGKDPVVIIRQYP